MSSNGRSNRTPAPPIGRPPSSSDVWLWPPGGRSDDPVQVREGDAARFQFADPGTEPGRRRPQNSAGVWRATWIRRSCRSRLDRVPRGRSVQRRLGLWGGGRGTRRLAGGNGQPIRLRTGADGVGPASLLHPRPGGRAVRADVRGPRRVHRHLQGVQRRAVREDGDHRRHRPGVSRATSRSPTSSVWATTSPPPSPC